MMVGTAAMSPTAMASTEPTAIAASWNPNAPTTSIATPAV